MGKASSNRGQLSANNTGQNQRIGNSTSARIFLICAQYFVPGPAHVLPTHAHSISSGTSFLESCLLPFHHFLPELFSTTSLILPGIVCSQPLLVVACPYACHGFLNVFCPPLFLAQFISSSTCDLVQCFCWAFYAAIAIDGPNWSDWIHVNLCCPTSSRLTRFSIILLTTLTHCCCFK